MTAIAHKNSSDLISLSMINRSVIQLDYAVITILATIAKTKKKKSR